LFITGEDQKNRAKKEEDRVQHECGSFRAPALKINPLSGRCDFVKAQDRKTDFHHVAYLLPILFRQTSNLFGSLKAAQTRAGRWFQMFFGSFRYCS